MRWIKIAFVVCTLAAPAGQARVEQDAAVRSFRLEQLSWTEAETLLDPETVVLIPLGAAAKEHGPHLKLNSDAVLAAHLTARVMDATSVVVAPLVTYHHYPAFLEYPGSTSLSLDTARDLTADIVRSLARHGPRRFYVLNTGISTARPLNAAAQALTAEGILLRYTDVAARLESAAAPVRRQEGGSHADEIETSMMLHIDAGAVDMSRAVKDYGSRSTPFHLTRRRTGQGTFSATGIWGDPTLATAAKGRVVLDALVAGITGEIEALRSLPLPDRRAAAAEPEPLRRRTSVDPPDPVSRCSAGDLRTIRAIGSAFTAHWANADALNLARLWTPEGDIVHPDGFVERTPRVILANRAELFRRREYRASRHPLQIGEIRCVADDIAVADGTWELRDVLGREGEILPPTKGLCTLVVKRLNTGWYIQAYRYTIDSAAPSTPSLLKRPGYPGRGGGPG